MERCAVRGGLLRRATAVAFILGSTASFWAGTPADPSQAQTAAASIIPPPLAALPAWTAFKDAWTNITAYSTTATIFEQNGTQTQNSIVDYTFRKPSSATLHVIKGFVTGVTLVWNGGDTVVAYRGKGLLAFFKRTLSLHDPQAETIRNSSIDKLSFAAIFSHARDMPGSLSQDFGPMILGIPTEAVTFIPTSSVADSGLSREIVDLSTISHLPLRLLGYEGKTLVRQVDFSNIALEH